MNEKTMQDLLWPAESNDAKPVSLEDLSGIAGAVPKTTESLLQILNDPASNDTQKRAARLLLKTNGHPTKKFRVYMQGQKVVEMYGEMDVEALDEDSAKAFAESNPDIAEWKAYEDEESKIDKDSVEINHTEEWPDEDA